MPAQLTSITTNIVTTTLIKLPDCPQPQHHCNRHCNPHLSVVAPSGSTSLPGGASLSSTRLPSPLHMLPPPGGSTTNCTGNGAGGTLHGKTRCASRRACAVRYYAGYQVWAQLFSNLSTHTPPQPPPSALSLAFSMMVAAGALNTGLVTWLSWHTNLLQQRMMAGRGARMWAGQQAGRALRKWRGDAEEWRWHNDDCMLLTTIKSPSAMPTETVTPSPSMMMSIM